MTSKSESLAAPCGVLVVDKPPGPTSHDVVAQIRRTFKTRKVGHAGTLDPMASGVLVVLLGEATKLAPYLTAHNKRYRALVEFGISTDSHDALGKTTATASLHSGWLTDAALSVALRLEQEREAQEPPVFSALKVDGERSHRLARAGNAPDLPERPVKVHSLELTARDETTAEIDLLVSKGYYVRSFARDLGATLGVPSHLRALRRLGSGCFSLGEACPWPLTQPQPLIAIDQAAERALPTGELTSAGLDKASKGQLLAAEDLVGAVLELPEGEPAAWIHAGRLVAVGVRRGVSFAVKRGFVGGPPASANDSDAS